jgi:hypothetical protein
MSSRTRSSPPRYLLQARGGHAMLYWGRGTCRRLSGRYLRFEHGSDNGNTRRERGTRLEMKGGLSALMGSSRSMVGMTFSAPTR